MASGGTEFRVWAPRRTAVEVVFEGKWSHLGSLALDPELNAPGYFSGVAAEAGAGVLYRYRLDGELGPSLADPASRSQPEGPFGPSQVIDPDAFEWTDTHWRGPQSIDDLVFYEMHIGTFTPEGTWKAAAEQLSFLKDLGVTTIELMPVNEFPGKFGWSYDGVNLFAPFHHYGNPDDFRRFVDQAHKVGLSVLLDVVYNHLGPEGNVLKDYSDDYFSSRHMTDWGEALNFDGENCAPVREFVVANVGYWVDEYHIDGIRVDATQSLFDMAEDHPHIVAELAKAIRAAGRSRERGVLVVGENETQSAKLLRPEAEGGCGFDMLWSDDFHHSAMVAATGRREGYYGDYLGSPQEFVSVLKRGWLYQGQWNLRQSKRRGTPAFGIPSAAFITFLQNHDQVANSGDGKRLHALTSPSRYRALTAMLLLGPNTPLIFQGQEYAAPTPFLYFGDISRPTSDLMQKGRREFFQQFPSLSTQVMQELVPHPADPEVFAQVTLNPSDREKGEHAKTLALHRDLLRIRREDATLRNRSPGGFDGAVLGPESFAFRWFDPEGKGEDRLLVVNLGFELRLDIAAEPLLAPPESTRWRLSWSSESPKYGGLGTPDPESECYNWRTHAHSAVLLAPEPTPEDEYRNPPGTISI